MSCSIMVGNLLQYWREVALRGFRSFSRFHHYEVLDLFHHAHDGWAVMMHD